jgi:hypothetical protein
MNPAKPGLIARFLEVSAVPAKGRGALCKNTQSTYTHWIRLFWQHVQPRPARTWTGADVETFMHRLAAEQYACPTGCSLGCI